MDALDIFAFIVMFVIVVSAVVLLVALGKLPGSIATKRNHPQAAAITACGWLGIATMGILWPIALVWAYLQPARFSLAENESASAAQKQDQPKGMAAGLEQLQKRIDSLEERLNRGAAS